MSFRSRPVAALALACAATLPVLSGCNSQNEAPPPPEATASAGPADSASGVVESDYGTPVKDRVATLGFLNKRNNITQELVLRTGEARRIGNAIIKLATCEKTAPWEDPSETGAFVQLFVQERATTQEKLAWHKVFSGWLFRNAPSLNVVQHPVYDVWVKDCAMKFPGEEESPMAAASSKSVEKPTGTTTPEAATEAEAAPDPADDAPVIEEAPPQ